MSFRLLQTNYLFFWGLDGSDDKLGMYPDESPGQGPGRQGIGTGISGVRRREENAHGVPCEHKCRDWFRG